MKKLLALLLCAMLFVSVVPASALADDVSGSAIELGPAYAAMNVLYNAYGQLGTATAAKNLYLGLDDYTRLFNGVDNPEALRVAAAYKLFIAYVAEDFVDDIEDLETTGVSPEMIYALMAPTICNGYTYLGDAVAVDCRAKELKAAADAVAKYDKAVEDVEVSVGKALADMLNTLATA